MKYSKPALTLEQQVELLRSRGLRIDDPTLACRFLAHINYYRFAGYVLPFEDDHATHQIRAGTRFEDILDLYVFDRGLRLLVLDALERIEISMRTQWAYHVAHGVSPHGYLDSGHASSASLFARQLAQLERGVEQSQETFVKHHKGKYTDPDLPPIWVACEVMSLGQLSQWYTMLRPLSLRKKIARSYGLDQQVLQSTLQHLNYVRNICAHHGRLWNREFVVTWSVPRKGAPSLLSAIADKQSRRPYNSLCLILFLLDAVSPGHSWRERLSALFAEHRPDMAAMGVPVDWQARALWQGGPV